LKNEPLRDKNRRRVVINMDPGRQKRDEIHKRYKREAQKKTQGDREKNGHGFANGGNFD